MNNQERKELMELKNDKNFLGKLSELFINRYRLSYLIIVFIMVMGYQAYYALPRESMPYVTIPRADITTTYPGASPTDVEKLVTDEIEAKVYELEDILTVTSTSSLGRSQITVEFTTGSDVTEKKNLLQAKVDEASFPSGVGTPSVAFKSTSDSPVMSLSVSGDYNIYELASYAEVIDTEINKVDGVGATEIIGALDRVIDININPIKLQNYGVTISNIQTALQDININTPLGSAELDGQYYNFRVDEQFTTVDEIKKTLIKNTAGEYVFLEEIAEVVDASSHQESYAGVYTQGGTEIPKTLQSVNIDVYREDGSDIVGSNDAIRTLIDKGNGVLYPEDVIIDVTYDESVDVKKDLADVTNNALSGLAVVIIVLFIFIGFSESLIVAAVIPLVMLMTLSVMNYLGLTLNGLSILGLIVSLGLVVDNAIVIMENVDRMRHMGLRNKMAAIIGTKQVAIAVFAATLTTVAAFYPLTTLSGVIGTFLKAIPEVVLIAVIMSLLVSLLITPVICSRHLPSKKKKWKLMAHPFMKYLPILLIASLSLYAFQVNGSITIVTLIATFAFTGAMVVKQFKFKNRHLEESALIKTYEKIIRSLLESKKKMIAFIVAGVLTLGVALSMFVLGYLPVGVFPLEEPTLVDISLTAQEGTTLEGMMAITAEVEKKLYEISEVETFNVSVGGSDKHVASVSATFIDANLRDKTGFDLQTQIQEEMKDISGANIQVAFDSFGGAAYDIDVQIVGDNLSDVRNVAEAYEKVLADMEGVEFAQLSAGDGIPQIQFHVNNNKAKALGLSASAVASELRMYISGSTLTTVRLDNTEIDVSVQLEDGQLMTTEDLNRLYITASNGDKIPVSAVADIQLVSGVSKIEHIDTSRVISVQGNLLSGYNANNVTNDFKTAVSEIALPSNLEVSYAGAASDMAMNFTEMANSMWIAVFLVYTVLAVQFNSMTQPLVIVASVPMALIGVIFGLMATGNEFGLYAFMGLVSLVGIAVNDAIVLVDYINYLRKNGVPIKEAIAKAGKTRFIPVFTTSLTTCGGILPLALKTPYYAQLGYSLIFGLMVATVLTLVFIPILYVLFEGRKNRFEIDPTENELVFDQVEV